MLADKLRAYEGRIFQELNKASEVDLANVWVRFVVNGRHAVLS